MNKMIVSVEREPSLHQQPMFIRVSKQDQLLTNTHPVKASQEADMIRELPTRTKTNLCPGLELPIKNKSISFQLSSKISIQKEVVEPTFDYHNQQSDKRNNHAHLDQLDDNEHKDNNSTRDDNDISSQQSSSIWWSQLETNRHDAQRKELVEAYRAYWYPQTKNSSQECSWCYSNRDEENSSISSNSSSSSSTSDVEHQEQKREEVFSALLKDCISCSTITQVIRGKAARKILQQQQIIATVDDQHDQLNEDYHDDDNKEDNGYNDEEKKEKKSILIVPPSLGDMRGLETKVLARSIIRRRRHHVKRVLEFHEAAKRRQAKVVCGSSTDTDNTAGTTSIGTSKGNLRRLDIESSKQDEMLRHHSLQTSRPSQIMARILAHADAVYVKAAMMH